MKNLYEINQRIIALNTEITTLQSEIIDTLEYQRGQGLKPNRNCDAITFREIRISIIEGEINGLRWVADEIKEEIINEISRI